MFVRAPTYLAAHHYLWNFGIIPGCGRRYLRGLLAPGTQTTTEVGYVRLHGRNGENWWGGGGERYDYSYTDEQLRVWIARLEEIKKKAKKVFIFFNNCHQGQAVKNAQRMLDLLRL